MQSLSWCLCFLALWHGQLIDASPNNGIVVFKESSLGNQETSPDSMPQNTPGSLEKSPDSMPQNTPGSLEKSATPPPPQNSNWNQKKWKLMTTTRVNVSKLNNSTWDALGYVTMKIGHNNNSFKIVLSGSKQEGSNQYINDTIDIRDVQDLQPPKGDSTFLRFTYGNVTYDLQFSTNNETSLYSNAISTARQVSH
nr:uncharacterized protein LOC109403061 isoform X2 [Aedes albopictus]